MIIDCFHLYLNYQIRDAENVSVSVFLFNNTIINIPNKGNRRDGYDEL